MPRRSGGGGGGRAPSRPTVPARKPVAPTAQQTRPNTTMAAPHAQAPPAQAAGPGLFGQMASTAAGVAVGSSIGHAIGGFFGGGGSSSVEQAAPQSAEMQQQQQQYSSNQSWGNNCADATTNFTKCLDENGGNMQICNWYLEQLKACQAAAKPY